MKYIFSIAQDEPSVLVSLDLLAAFETMYHKTFLGNLRSWFHLNSIALMWCHSYLSDHSQATKIGLTLSDFVKPIVSRDWWHLSLFLLDTLIVFASKAQHQKVSSHFHMNIGDLLHPDDTVGYLGMFQCRLLLRTGS